MHITNTCISTLFESQVLISWMKFLLLLFLILLHTSTLYEAQINALEAQAPDYSLKSQPQGFYPSLMTPIPASRFKSQLLSSNFSPEIQIPALRILFRPRGSKFDLKAQIPVSMLLWLIS